MANTSSAKKMLRKIERRTLINKMRKSMIKTYMKKVIKSVLSGNKLDAILAFREVQPHLHRAVGKGIFHKNNVARKLSALSAKVKAMPGEFICGPIKK